MKTKAKELRKELKEKLGLNSKKVSVRINSYISIDVTLKDLEAVKKLNEIEEIAKKYEDISYDEVTGEILSGGNDYVFVNIDWRLAGELRDKIIEKLPYKSVKGFEKTFKIDGVKIHNFNGESVGVEIDGVDDYIPTIKYYQDLGEALLYILIKYAPEKLELFL